MSLSELQSEKLGKLFQEDQGRPNLENALYYEDMESKATVFGSSLRFDSTTRFLDFVLNELPAIVENRTFLYRGIEQASYRLFSKAQRSYRANKSNDITDERAYHALIEEMIKKAKSINGNALYNFLNGLGAKDNDISVLSFLQHYGAPTPIMDWTTDIFVSLYFAISKLTNEELENYNNHYHNEIDGYFSIYMMPEDNTLNSIRTFKPLTTKKSGNYTTLKKKKLAYINEGLGAKATFKIANNLHIANQKGLFIYNNSSHLPLEEVFIKLWFMYYLYNTAADLNVPRSPLICLNINKRIAINLKNELNQRGYIKSTIFPKPETIAKHAVPRNLK